MKVVPVMLVQVARLPLLTAIISVLVSEGGKAPSVTRTSTSAKRVSSCLPLPQTVQSHVTRLYTIGL